MATNAPPFGWRRDEQGDLYRLLTPSEREQVIAAREEDDVCEEEDVEANEPQPKADVARAA